MLELFRWQNRQQKGIKPRFRIGSVLLKNRGFGTDFDNRNNTIHLLKNQYSASLKNYIKINRTHFSLNI